MYYILNMTTISKRELNQNTAHVLEQVTPLEPLTVTERGVPKWIISSHSSSESMLDRLAAKGVYTPPSQNPEPWDSANGSKKYTDAEVEEILAEDKGMY